MTLNYSKISPELVDKIKSVVGKGNVITDPEKMVDYSHDEFPQNWIHSLPELVVKPESTEAVQELVKLANEFRFPLTPRGSATGLCGGCVPHLGGVVLSLENMNKIYEVDKDNLMVTAGAGTTLTSLYAAIESTGLFFPPHPGDESATLGGVISTNAGGARAVKYGIVRTFVRGIEVVLPTGEVINVGGKLMKNSTGYSLLHLFIGSEGTLGIVTKATINLLPPPTNTLTLVVPYPDIKSAISTVPKIFAAKIIPLAIEFIESDPIKVAEAYFNKKWPVDKGQAHLMIVIDGSESEVLRQSETIAEVCLANSAIDVFVANTKEKQKEILDMRSNLYEPIKKFTLEILDICVPPASISDFVAKIHELADKYQSWLPTYGHAGDGNVHTHLMRVKYESGKLIELTGNVEDKTHRLRNELHAYALSIGGTISGEHGIGLVKKEYLPIQFPAPYLKVLKNIKHSFDPNNILNPGKIFDF